MLKCPSLLLSIRYVLQCLNFLSFFLKFSASFWFILQRAQLPFLQGFPPCILSLLFLSQIHPWDSGGALLYLRLLHHLHCRSWCCPFKYRFPFRCSYPLICRRYSGENGGRGSRGPPLPSGRGYSVFALLGACNLLLASELQWRNTLTTPLLLQSVASLPMI